MKKPHQSLSLFLLQGKRTSVTKDELKATNQGIEKVHSICQTEDKGGTELLAELAVIFQCVR